MRRLTDVNLEPNESLYITVEFFIYYCLFPPIFLPRPACITCISGVPEYQVTRLRLKLDFLKGRMVRFGTSPHLPGA